MNVLGLEEMRERLEAVVSEASVSRDRATRQKLPMGAVMSLVVDEEDWAYREDWPRYQRFYPWFPPLDELIALAFVSLVPLTWTPADGADGIGIGNTIEDGEEPAFGSVYTRKLEFETAALLIPDEEDPVPRVLFEFPEHSGSSVVALTLMDRVVTAVTLFRQHCGTVSSGCVPQRTRCTCRVVRVRSRRDGTTWQCRCTQHQVP